MAGHAQGKFFIMKHIIFGKPIEIGWTPNTIHTLFQQKSYLAITRKQYQIGMFNLNPLQFAFLYYWQNNIQQTIPQALTQFASDNSMNIGEMKSLWQIWKAKWVEVGFFTV